MAYIKDRKKNLRTVGEVIDALSRFERDMPISTGLGDAVEVHREEPEENERYEDERGAICIQESDDYDDEEE